MYFIFREITHFEGYLNGRMKLFSRLGTVILTNKRGLFQLIILMVSSLINYHHQLIISQTKYEMSVNGQELHLISWKSNELTAVEEKIRQMLDEMITYEFQLSHAQRSLLKLNNLVNIRSLFEYGQEV